MVSQTDDTLNRIPRLSLDHCAAGQGIFSAALAVTAHVWAATDIALGAGLALALALISAGAWGLGRRWDHAGRWALIGGSVAWVALCQAVLGQSAASVLLVAPVGMSVAMLGWRAGLSALATSAILVLIQSGPPFSTTITLIALCAVWLVVAATDQIGRRMHEQGIALYQTAMKRIATAQEQEAHLRFALDDLARANVQLARLNDLTQGLRQAAEQARADKEQFAANISHELRAPLNIILGFSNMLLESSEGPGWAIPAPVQADLAVIQRNAAHLSALIDDVLDLSQIEAGHLALDRAYTALDEVIHQAVELTRGLFETKRLRLQVEIEPGLPAVYCDAVRIRQVLINLINNAWRFTEQGSVTVRAAQDGTQVRVSVSDTGPGIAPEKAARLFKPFQQADSDIHKHYGGTGLGLAISRQLVELHGGRIGVESREQAGATFYFELPIDPPSTSASFRAGLYENWEFHQRTQRPAIQPPPARPRVLVVEQGNTLQRALQRHLDSVEVATAPDVRAAGELLGQSPAHALVINATTVTEGLISALRADDRLAGAPTIVCAFPQINPSGLPENARRLTKPVSRQALARAFSELNVRGGRLLIVDDDPDTLQLFERMALSIQPDFRIWLARNGAEALQIMTRQTPDAILLDLRMPHVDGWQVLARRADMQRDSGQTAPPWTRAPVIVVSAQDDTTHAPLSPALVFAIEGGFTTQHLARSVAWISRLAWQSAAIDDPAFPAAPGASPA